MRAYSKKRERKGAFANRPCIRNRLTVRARPGQPTKGLINAGGIVFPCALGRGGISADKREGDGATPLASMAIIAGFYRPDRFRPGSTRLAMTAIRPDLGWCEVPDDRNYNRAVTIPYAAGHETMLRDDGLYDCCIVLDWNIRPRRRGRGSAIFFHLARPGFTPTQGCVAVTRAVMARLLRHLSRQTVMTVTR